MVFLKTFPTSELSFSVMELHGIDYVNFFFKSLKSFLKFTVHVWLSPSLIRRRFFKKKRRERHRSVYTSFMRKGPLTSRVCVPLWFLVFYFKDFFFFLMWTIFKVFIEFVTILPLFYVLVFWPRGMWDLSSLTRDRTHTPCTGRWSLNHWTAREVPVPLCFFSITCHH